MFDEMTIFLDYRYRTNLRKLIAYVEQSLLTLVFMARGLKKWKLPIACYCNKGIVKTFDLKAFLTDDIVVIQSRV